VVIERIQYDGPASGGNPRIYDGPARGGNAGIGVTRQYGKPAVPYEYVRIAGRKRNGALYFNARLRKVELLNEQQVQCEMTLGEVRREISRLARVGERFFQFSVIANRSAP